MYQRVKGYIQKYHMLDREDKVIAGVSGGADSICLLFMLLELKKELGFELLAVHVHHGLRGTDADADAAYVEKTCREQGAELRIFHEDVGAYAKKHKLSTEEAGRDVRREIFWQVAEETGGTKIALAHHQNDNAETLIWNLCRGCSLKGMGGIAPAEGKYIRPLMCLNRSEIEAYLADRGISYCTDATNLEDVYTRNRIRGHVIPYLEENVNSQAVLHIAEMTEQMRRIGAYIEQETRRYEKNCIRYAQEGTAVLQKEEFEQVPEALKSGILYNMLCHVAGKKKDIELGHIRMLEELLGKQVGRRFCFPYGVTAIRCYEGLELYQEAGGIQDEIAEVYPNNGWRQDEAEKSYPECGQDCDEEEKLYHEVGGNKNETQQQGEESVCQAALGDCLNYEVPASEREAGYLGTGLQAQFRIFDRTPDMVIFPENPYTKWFDYDIIKNTVKIRHREPGDRIVIDRQGNTQKLKQYFINEKIPEKRRDQIWLVADGQQIMWVIGYRQSQGYQITDKTKRILEIEMNEGESDGREC